MDNTILFKKFSNRLFNAMLILLGVLVNARGQEGYSTDPNIDYSKCKNCEVFPKRFMEVNDDDLIDFSKISPERHMDFLIGEWQIYYPDEQSPGFEIFQWFHQGLVVEGLQDWSLHPDYLDKIPWRAKSFFIYVEKEKRWQFHWIAKFSSTIFSGGMAENNTLVFYENEPKGGPNKLHFSYPVKYVFKNVTHKSFLIEWFDSEDNGETYPFLKWRVYYKKKTG